MPTRDAARDLLLGLLAFQNNFLDRAALLGAFDDWNAHPDRPLAAILKDRGALGIEHLAALSTLVDLHVRRHGGDPHQSLAAVGPLGSLRDDLAKLPDAGLQASLVAASPAATSAVGGRDPTTITYDRPRDPGMRFRFLRPHAKGGLGQVSVALDEELDREVALKEIQEKHADRPDSRSRFVMEAEITGKLEHPGIIPVYGMGYYGDGRPYYAMRFVRGGSLKEAIERFHGPDGPKDATARSLALRDLLDRFLDVCDAIAYAHSRGVLHRDLKPGNVMLGKFGETLVVDWGLAKPLGASCSTDGEATIRPTRAAASGGETLAGSAMGTPAYMSPEQAEGRLDLMGPRSDVYGLGATLYALLTGAAPFSGDDVGAILQRVARGEVVPPRDRDRRVPRALDAICRKAMATVPSSRYADARSLAADVKRWLADEPVSARRDPLPTRAWRWVRKHRTATTAAAAVLLVGTTALAVAWRREAAFSADLLASQAVADRRLDDTLGAVKDYYTGVGEEVLLEQPQLKALRDRLLTKPRQFYEKLAADLAASGASDARSLELLARARLDLGNILVQVGEMEAAGLEFAAAAAAYGRLTADQPGVPEYRDGLARSYSNLGAAQAATGANADTIASFEKAIALGERLAADQPGVPEYRNGLALSYNNLGLAQQVTGATAEAIASFEKAIEQYGRLVDDQPGVPDYRTGLARSYSGLGVAQAATGATADAIANYAKAIAALRPLVAAQPQVIEYQHTLGGSLCNLGNALLGSGQAHEAEAAFTEGVSVEQAVFRRSPNNPAARQFLNNNYWGLAIVLRAQRRGVEAAEVTRERRVLWPGVAVEQFYSARELALCVPIVDEAGRDALGAEAMEALREAVLSGWSDAVHTAHNADLDALRGREDFRRVLAGMFDQKFPESVFVGEGGGR